MFDVDVYLYNECYLVYDKNAKTNTIYTAAMAMSMVRLKRKKKEK